jgi:hypothetical protein
MSSDQAPAAAPAASTQVSQESPAAASSVYIVEQPNANNNDNDKNNAVLPTLTTPFPVKRRPTTMQKVKHSWGQNSFWSQAVKEDVKYPGLHVVGLLLYCVLLIAYVVVAYIDWSKLNLIDLREECK